MYSPVGIRYINCLDFLDAIALGKRADSDETYVLNLCDRLGFTGMQVGNTPHGKSRQIRHQHPFVTRQRDRQCTHRSRLVNDEQNLPVFSELAGQRSQFPFVVGQRDVQQAFALAIKGYGMMRTLAYVDTDEDRTVSCCSISVMPSPTILQRWATNHGN